MDDQRAAEGVEHLQRAAHELIAAARLFLDALDDVIDEPEWITKGIAAVVETIGDLGSHRSQPWESHAWTTAEDNPDQSDAFSDDEETGPDDSGSADAETGRVETGRAATGLSGSGDDGTGDDVTGAAESAGARKRTSVRRISVD